MSPTNPGMSALASAYMNIYAPRPPFPFYPPLGGPGFPVFPGGHPLTMTPPMMPDAKFPGGSVTPKLPSGETLLTPEAKRDGSECSDSSDVSSTSDLDTTGSDLDSEHGSDKKTDKSQSPGPISGVRTSTPVKSEQPAPEADDTPRRETPPPVDRKSPASSTTSNNSSSSKDELPFDLSKTNSRSPRGKSEADLPLDLSVKSKDEEDTPRKTHIFGEKKSKDVKPKPKTVEKPKDHHKEVIRPEIPSPPKELERSQPVFPIREPAPVHSAFGMQHALMMDPMYRVSKEKIQSMHETRMHNLQMAFGHSTRIPIPGQHFPPMMPTHPSFMPYRDPTKLPSHLLGKTPDGPFPHPHPQFPHPNKLKERYACKFCGKIFPRSANLTRHLRTHTGLYK